MLVTSISAILQILILKGEEERWKVREVLTVSPGKPGAPGKPGGPPKPYRKEKV